MSLARYPTASTPAFTHTPPPFACTSSDPNSAEPLLRRGGGRSSLPPPAPHLPAGPSERQPTRLEREAEPPQVEARPALARLPQTLREPDPRCGVWRSSTRPDSLPSPQLLLLQNRRGAGAPSCL